VTHKNSEGVFPKPNKTPQLQTTKIKGKEGLVMMARKGDLKELSEPMPHSLYSYTMKILFPLMTYPLLFQVLFLMCYRNMRMSFQRRYHQGRHLREELNIKLTLFLVLHFQTELHSAPIWRKQKKFSNKWKN